jgi:cytochrome c553
MRKNKLEKKAFLKIVILSFLGCSVVGCTKEKRQQSISDTGGSVGSSSLSSLQTDIFALSCATSGCHDNRATPAGSLSMISASVTHTNMVNRNSLQATALKIVLPNDPGNSYLINKLEATHASVGGTGVRMPQYERLSEANIARIVAWINNGAPLD